VRVKVPEIRRGRRILAGVRDESAPKGSPAIATIKAKAGEKEDG
jgi:hypothetical protein